MTPRIPTKLTLKEGRYYVRRDGKIVGPTKASNCGWYPFWCGICLHTIDGHYYKDGGKDPRDLISEVPAKRIAPEKARKCPLSSHEQCQDCETQSSQTTTGDRLLRDIHSQLEAMNASPHHAVSWVEPRTDTTTKLLARIQRFLNRVPALPAPKKASKP